MTEIDWIPVSAGTILLGDGRGALIHASAAPLHEVRIEADFEISATPITFAWFNASSRYLNDSWLNIAVGGIFFSLMTSFLWRPRLPSYHIDDEGRVRRVI